MASGSTAQAETLISPQQLRDDLREMRRVIAEIPPDPGFSADGAALEAAYCGLDAEFAGLEQGLSRDRGRGLQRLPVLASRAGSSAWGTDQAQLAWHLLRLRLSGA